MAKHYKKKKKSQKEVPHNLPFPNLRIDCYGKSTYVYLDGMDISGVRSVNFRTAGGETPVLDLTIEPHAASLEKVKLERVDTALVTERHRQKKGR